VPGLMGLLTLPSKRSSPFISRGKCQIKSRLPQHILSFPGCLRVSLPLPLVAVLALPALEGFYVFYFRWLCRKALLPLCHSPPGYCGLLHLCYFSCPCLLASCYSCVYGMGFYASYGYDWCIGVSITTGHPLLIPFRTCSILCRVRLGAMALRKRPYFVPRPVGSIYLNPAHVGVFCWRRRKRPLSKSGRGKSAVNTSPLGAIPLLVTGFSPRYGVLFLPGQPYFSKSLNKATITPAITLAKMSSRSCSIGITSLSLTRRIAPPAFYFITFTDATTLERLNKIEAPGQLWAVSLTK
jgi:hypothetical protein